MADENKKPIPIDEVEFIFIILMLMVILQTLAPTILEYINQANFPPILEQIDQWLRFILKFIAIFSLAGIFFVQIRFYQMSKENIIVFEDEEIGEEEIEHNKKWDRIVNLSNSSLESDWKIAIIEADSILNDMVSRMGYPGENLGERLKNIEKSDFITLDCAWEAHKFRNRIAHENEFHIRKDQISHIIGQYQKVFREFGFI